MARTSAIAPAPGGLEVGGFPTTAITSGFVVAGGSPGVVPLVHVESGRLKVGVITLGPRVSLGLRASKRNRLGWKNNNNQD
jgi:hypothetical protein